MGCGVLLTAGNTTAGHAAGAAAPNQGSLKAAGSLAERDVLDLLRELREGHWSGTLALSHMGFGRTVTVYRGSIVAAASSSPDDGLAELLLRRGRVTLEQYIHATQTATAGKPFEAVILEGGVLTGADLMRAMADQAQEAVAHAVQWTEGRYQLTPADDATAPVMLKLKAGDVIFEAIRGIHSWARVCKGIGGLEARFLRASDYASGAKQMTLSPESGSILAGLATPQDIRTICNKSKMPAFEVCRTLWAFHVLGLVSRVGAAASPRANVVLDTVDDEGLNLALSESASVPPAPVTTRAAVAQVVRNEPEADNESSKRILAVGVGRELFQKMEPLLSRAALIIDRVPRPQSALVLCEQRRFDLVIALASFSDMPIRQFLAELRKPQSKCSRAHVILLSEDPSAAQVSPDEALATVLPLQAPTKVVDEVAMRVLGVEPRQSQRLMIRVDVQLDQGRQLVMCQTENISRVGMLLRSQHPFPVGTKLAFDFTPPGDRSPIRGKAEVVRHSVADIENVNGVGVKLLDFQADGRSRWEEFLAKSVS
jgi:hypothetical protein